MLVLFSQILAPE